MASLVYEREISLAYPSCPCRANFSYISLPSKRGEQFTREKKKLARLEQTYRTE